jgi:hypothetical protein
MTRTAASGVVLVLLIASACAATVAAIFEPPLPPANRPLERRAGGYASSKACQACHPAEHASWHASYHRTMTQPATPETVLAPVQGVELASSAAHYRLEQRGDQILGHPQEPGGFARRIVMTTGSHHFQAFWMETHERRKVALFPFAYHIAERQWIPFDSLMLSPPLETYRQATAEGGEWNKRCIRCHATQFEPRLFEEGGIDSQGVELGIACEACHGPGERHVKANASPLRRYALHFSGARDETIVQPGELDHRRSADVCGQCHSAEVLPDREGIRRWSREGTAFRPGQVLGETRQIKIDDGPQTLHDDISTAFWSDGMPRVNSREYNGLLRSPCFQRGELDCLSCHEMHAERVTPSWLDDQLAAGMRGSGACTQCHPDLETDTARSAHSHHAPDSAGSACMNCHMPYTSWGLQKASRTHEIHVPTVGATLETGRPHACNLCHLDRSLAWTAEHLERWYGLGAPPLEPLDRELAAGARYLVLGDAGQRSLLAWAMGWEPAREASGTDWMAPYLGMQLLDPYPAARAVALRSLRTLPGYEGFEADYTKDDTLPEAVQRVGVLFRARDGAPQRAGAAELLIDEAGGFRMDRYQQLLAARNERRVYLLE